MADIDILIRVPESLGGVTADEAQGYVISIAEALAEVHEVMERLRTIASAPQMVEQANTAYAVAIGRKDGDPWIQPLGAHDSYSGTAVVTHGDKTWESLTPYNTWEPGVSGWREVVEEGVADFVQPTGAHDAYDKGDKVRWEGQIYESVIDGNTYSPSAYPPAWKLIEP